MVKVAIAGYGEVSREIIQAIIDGGQHEISVLSRRSPPTDVHSDINWITVNYDNKANLVAALKGIHTVLSFIFVSEDKNNESQINLINASIESGVKRFAPSEWSTYLVEGFPGHGGKAEIREYLRAVNEKKKVLEYCLFIPGLFMDYLGPAEKLNKNLTHAGTFVDFQSCAAILPDVADATVSFTTVKDVANVVARAVSYEGEWPVFGGIAGSKITLTNLIKLGAKIRGKEFKVERVKIGDLEAGQLKTSWVPSVQHPAIPPDLRKTLAEQVTAYSLLGISRGDWDIPETWNRLLPDFKFVNIEDFLHEAWAGVP